MTKQQKLHTLKTKMLNDQALPLRKTATQLVFGEGNPDADLYFLGEAPGKVEDESGRPFVGRSGKLLDALLEQIGIPRESVYITSVVRFRPPANRQPTPSEIAAFLPYVNEEIAIIDPKLIIPLGRFALEKFFPEAKISHVHGQLLSRKWANRTIHLFPLFHPAAALRSPQIREQLQKDFQKLPDIIKRF